MSTSKNAEGHIPSLDGIRAFAIYTVIALHLYQRFANQNASHPLGAAILLLSGLGVDGVGIFFVLSGFLITTLLLREQAKTSRISLSSFYIRRAFRILPPLYAYLLFVALFCVAGKYPLHAATITGSLFFYLNYFNRGAQWFTQHTWSLCVEEQFYLLWPITYIWAFRHGGRRFAVKLVIAMIALTPAFRFLSFASHLGFTSHNIGAMLQTRMDGLMCGCLAALLTGTKRFEDFYQKMKYYWWLFALEFLLISPALSLYLGPHYRNSIGYTIDSICMMLFIVWASRNPSSFAGRILNHPVMARIGILSYSIYLWQTFFIHADNPTRLNHLPWALGYILIAALLSYYFIEQPSLRIRKIIERRRQQKAALAATPA